ncbi:MAG: MCP four helix bundle domain-containing protein [Chlorobiaceae bacterium]|nr:MCP four helix bundle domain-containing protein [Chlorobiaceae bacterium]
MNRDEREAGKSIGLAWAASLVATALITLLASFWLHSASFMSAGNASMEKQALLADMRVNLMRSVEKEKSAVLATTDEDSRTYAEQSKTSAKEVDRDLKTLEAMVADSGSEKEKELVAKLSESWKTVTSIDAGLLEAATENTNTKALDLSATMGDELVRKIDGNLEKLTERVKPEWRKAQMDKIAESAKLAIRNLVILQTRHVNAADEAAKKSIEASMQAEQKSIDTALATLDKMTGKKSRPYIREAKTEFSEFMRLNAEIVRLSTLDTNHKSTNISLGEKRKAEAECDRTLEALQKLAAKKP